MLERAEIRGQELGLVTLTIRLSPDQQTWPLILSRLMGIVLAHYPKKPDRDVKKATKNARRFFDHFAITDPATHEFPLTNPPLADQAKSWTTRENAMGPLMALATLCTLDTGHKGLLLLIDGIHHASRAEIICLCGNRRTICHEDGPLALILGGNQNAIARCGKDFPDDSIYTPHRLERLTDP